MTWEREGNTNLDKLNIDHIVKLWKVIVVLHFKEGLNTKSNTKISWSSVVASQVNYGALIWWRLLVVTASNKIGRVKIRLAEWKAFCFGFSPPPPSYAQFSWNPFQSQQYCPGSPRWTFLQTKSIITHLSLVGDCLRLAKGSLLL